MMTNYVKETDEQLRRASNRTFRRLLASLPSEVAQRYGHEENRMEDLEAQLREVIAAKDWPKVADLSTRLAAEKCCTDGLNYTFQKG